MAEIERTELTLRMDATVTVYDATGQATNWLKPGSEMTTTWKGDPTDAEVALRYNSMKDKVAVTLEDVLVATRARLMEVQMDVLKGKNG